MIVLVINTVDIVAGKRERDAPVAPVLSVNGYCTLYRSGHGGTSSGVTGGLARVALCGNRTRPLAAVGRTSELACRFDVLTSRHPAAYGQTVSAESGYVRSTSAADQVQHS